MLVVSKCLRRTLFSRIEDARQDVCDVGLEPVLVGGGVSTLRKVGRTDLKKERKKESCLY